MAVFFYEPGVLEEGVAGVMEGQQVTMGMAHLNAAMVALPLALAAVTLFLPARASGITNLVVGVPFGAFGLFAIVPELAESGLQAHLTLVALATAIIWLIVALSIAETAAALAPERRDSVSGGRVHGAGGLAVQRGEVVPDGVDWGGPSE